MTEENNGATPRELAVEIAVVAVDAPSVKDAEKLRLEITGDADYIMAFAALNVRYLQALFGDQFSLTDAEGNPISGPTKINPLGDDPGAE